jgi:DNA mismatch repair protein MutS
VKAQAGLTPMMAQYLELKREHPDAILLFRMGDFYETFLTDAQEVSALLGLTLTSREKRGDEAIPLAGIPYHALEHYLGKLLELGRTVAICEQLEDPAKAKGLVRRGVVEVISPGTVTNPALLRGDDSVYLLAVAEPPDRHGAWGYALLDGSTGELRCGESDRDELLALTRRCTVGEMLLSELGSSSLPTEGNGAGPKSAAVTRVSPLLFQSSFAAQTLCDHFRVHGVAGLGLADLPLATCAAGAALRYLADRQRARPDQVTRLVVERAAGYLHLDRETLAHLELFEGLRGGDAQATLFHQLNATVTPMGRRTLAAWLRQPLCDVAGIARRQDAVEWLVQHAPAAEEARAALRGVGDLERIASRIATQRALPHELGALRAGLLRLPRVQEVLAEAEALLLSEPAASLREAARLAEPLQRELAAELPSHLRAGGVVCPGVDGELDRLRDLAGGGKRWLASYQEQLRERTGIPSLKVAYNKVFGYYLEVTTRHIDKVPVEFEERATLAGAKRYITAELKQRERAILSADEERIEREAVVFAALLARLAQELPALRGIAVAAGVLDALLSLAQVARARAWVRPVVDASDVLEVEDGRHPVVERLVAEPFTPNDLALDGQRRQLLLLTGPNMGGKSTFLRQAAVLVVLAQMGSFVPARRARIGVVDRLFTRVGASDNLARGQSTFLVEMAETANILRNATSRSLVILDEVGRGTSTDDGLALAWAITEYLHDGPARPKTLFATHFHELTDLSEALPRAANFQMEVRERDGQILFLHRVLPGVGDRSYGIHVAELAGVPVPVLERARAKLEELLAAGAAASAVDQGRHAARRAGSASQLALFTPPPRAAWEAALLAQLRALECDRLRPIEALAILAELAAAAREGRPPQPWSAARH